MQMMGTGYLCWDWERNDSENPGEKDGGGETFKIPKIWPEGSEDDKRPYGKWKTPKNALVNTDKLVEEVRVVYSRKIQRFQLPGRSG
jgi:hypothetical protein